MGSVTHSHVERTLAAIQKSVMYNVEVIRDQRDGDEQDYRRTNELSKATKARAPPPPAQRLPPSSQHEDEPDTGLILRENNDRLVSYIDKARLMAGVGELQGALPGTLRQTTFIEVQCQEAIQAETEMLQLKIEQTRNKKVIRIKELERKKKDNLDLDQSSQKATEAYWRREKEKESQDDEAAVLAGRLESTKLRQKQLTEQIQGMEEEINKKKQKVVNQDVDDPSVEYSAAMDKVELVNVHAGPPAQAERRRQELEEVAINMRLEYEERMKAQMQEQRRLYLERYQKMLVTIEQDSQELVRIYLEAGKLIQARAIKEVVERNLLRLEDYHERKEMLEAEIQEMVKNVNLKKGEIAALGGEGVEGISLLEKELETKRIRLAELLPKITEHVR